MSAGVGTSVEISVGVGTSPGTVVAGVSVLLAFSGVSEGGLAPSFLAGVDKMAANSEAPFPSKLSVEPTT